MSDTYSLALYGATGALGTEVRAGLEGSEAPIRTLVPVAGVRSAGETVPWGGQWINTISAAEVPTEAVDLAIFACPPAIAAHELSPLRRAGCLVIDLTGAHLAGELLPIVWPGLADAALQEHPGGFALPCAAASTLAPVLDALAGQGLAPGATSTVAMVGATDAGAVGAETLSKQTIGLLSHQIIEQGPFADVLAFNALTPTVGAADADQARMAIELAALVPAATGPHALGTVRIAAFSGLAGQITVHCPGASEAAARDALERHPLLTMVEGGFGLRDATNVDTVLVSPPRIVGDQLSVFVASDPLHRIGVAVAGLVERVIAQDLW